MDALTSFNRVLKGMGIHFSGVSAKDVNDPRTWEIQYTAEATALEKAAAAARLASFDPTDPALKEADQVQAAATASAAQATKVICRFVLYVVAEAHANGTLVGVPIKDANLVIDPAMVAAVNTLLERCYKETAP